MDWNNIVSFIAGGLIAIIPVIVANRYQARERDKDRLEQRREAKTQLALELRRNDVKAIHDALLAMFEVFNALQLVRIRKSMGRLSEKEMRDEIELMLSDKNSKFYKLSEVDSMTDLLARTINTIASQGVETGSKTG